MICCTHPCHSDAHPHRRAFFVLLAYLIGFWCGRRRRPLTFGGAGTLAYLNRVRMGRLHPTGSGFIRFKAVTDSYDDVWVLTGRGVRR